MHLSPTADSQPTSLRNHNQLTNLSLSSIVSCLISAILYCTDADWFSLAVMSYEDLDADVARETDDASRHINITLRQSTKNEGL